MDGSTWNNLAGQTATTLDVTTLYTNTPWFRVQVTSGENAPAYSTTMFVSSRVLGTLFIIR